MSFFQAAQALAKQGFYVFPVQADGKLPACEFKDQAINDPNDLSKFWYDPVMKMEHPYNIGIYTGRYKKNQALLVVDVDNKKGKTGDKTLLDLTLEGFKFPKTLTQTTPTGGRHLIYRCTDPVIQSASKLGSGIDIRSRGGYIVGAGSFINGKAYTIDNEKIAIAPKWLVERCGVERKSREVNVDVSKINQESAKKRALSYLKTAPRAMQGDGGDQTTFNVAAKLKDFGLTIMNARDLLHDHWNQECEPPWEARALEDKVRNAYAYSQNKAGIDSPQSDFEDVSENSLYLPVMKLNKEFSFLVQGGKSTILHHPLDDPETQYMTVQAFKDLIKSETIQTSDGKIKPLSEHWMASTHRNTYIGVDFNPMRKPGKRRLNLWRGYGCEPLAKNEAPTKDMQRGLDLFHEHALKNVCDGDEKHFNWLMGYFAHMIQRPWEKPLTALVFQGKKGVGKNALVERVGKLFARYSGHYQLTSDPNKITSNFNKHLEKMVFFVLDEASWSGNKQAESRIKDLITGGTHNIEQKGKEIYEIRNCLRLVILGNDAWLVPATFDERRFAVFMVGDGRMRDKPFFIDMRNCIDNKGGNRLLLTYLQNFDLKTVDVDEAPVTKGLLQQKLQTLDPFFSWWYSCLTDEKILGLSEFNSEWPKSVGRERMRDAYISHVKSRGVSSWRLDPVNFGKHLVECCPGAYPDRKTEEGRRVGIYTIPPLATARDQFDRYLGHDLPWESDSSRELDLFS